MGDLLIPIEAHDRLTILFANADQDPLRPGNAIIQYSTRSGIFSHVLSDLNVTFIDIAEFKDLTIDEVHIGSSLTEAYVKFKTCHLLTLTPSKASLIFPQKGLGARPINTVELPPGRDFGHVRRSVLGRIPGSPITTRKDHFDPNFSAPYGMLPSPVTAPLAVNSVEAILQYYLNTADDSYITRIVQTFAERNLAAVEAGLPYRFVPYGVSGNAFKKELKDDI